MIKRRIGILTGGGDVPPLNALLHAVNRASVRSGFELIGFHYGWKGVYDKLYTSLSKVSLNPNIGGTILRSSRMNLREVSNGATSIISNLENLGIEGLIVVGGEDTLSNSYHLPDFPQILISKTIDNDVGVIRTHERPFRMSDIVNYFTLGHPTAAQTIASFVSLGKGMRTTAYSHERIIVVESMGMHAGWLALSSCIGRPDFIIVPEFPLFYDLLVQRVADLYRKQHHVIIVVAEGARWSDGNYMSAGESEKDDFGHPRFRGAAEVLANRLKIDLKSQFHTRNINAVNPSYLYRSGAPSGLDRMGAELLGKAAVHNIKEGIHGSHFMTIQKTSKRLSFRALPITSYKSIEDFHRFLDERFYDSDTFGPTRLALRYWRTLVQDFPILEYGL